MSELISVAEARRRVLRAVVPPGRSELVPVEHASGRTLAADLAATADVPPFANSAMDGWAVRTGGAGRRLRIVGESRAGRPADRGPVDGQAVRISTGAALPPGAEAVVPLEDADEDGDHVVVRTAARAGLHVRGAGEDMRAGEAALRAGTLLSPAALALAVAAGAAEVPCAPEPPLAVLSTGDELRPPGAELGPGEIHNSNGVGLTALARAAGARVLRAAVVPDGRAATEKSIAAALAEARVVVVSGGVSVGPHDHVKPALAALGVREEFWGVSLRPGKPTWFGVAPSGALVFGLPGNPVSALVTFRLFVSPALRALLGGGHEAPAPVALLAVPVVRGPREHAMRVRLEAVAGTLRAVPATAQGSHQLKALAEADGLALIPAGEGELAAGEPVEVLLLGRS